MNFNIAIPKESMKYLKEPIPELIKSQHTRLMFKIHVLASKLGHEFFQILSAIPSKNTMYLEIKLTKDL